MQAAVGEGQTSDAQDRPELRAPEHRRRAGNPLAILAMRTETPQAAGRSARPGRLRARTGRRAAIERPIRGRDAGPPIMQVAATNRPGIRPVALDPRAPDSVDHAQLEIPRGPDRQPVTVHGDHSQE